MYPKNPKFPLVYRIEFGSSNGKSPAAAIDEVIGHLRAASDLDVPVSLVTEHSKQFRHGGNVNKADVIAYVVTVGELTEVEDD